MEEITRFEHGDDQLLIPYSVNPGLSTGGMGLSDCLIFPTYLGPIFGEWGEGGLLARLRQRFA